MMGGRAQVPESSSEPALSVAEWGKLFAGRANDGKSTGPGWAATHGLHHCSAPPFHRGDGGPEYAKQSQSAALAARRRGGIAPDKANIASLGLEMRVEQKNKANAGGFLTAAAARTRQIRSWIPAPFDFAQGGAWPE